jgi:hypothetical protein
VLVGGFAGAGAGDGEDEDGEEGEVDDGEGRRVSCGVVVHRLEDGFVARANTIPTYFELNRQVGLVSSLVFSCLSSVPLYPSSAVCCDRL